MKKTILGMISGILMVCFSGSAMAAGQDYLSLLGLNNLTAPTSLASLQKTKVPCNPNGPPRAKAVNWTACISGIQDISVAGLFGFDYKSILQSIQTAACSYARQQTGAFLSQAAAPIHSAVSQAGGALGGLGQVSTPIGGTNTGITTDVQQGTGGTTGVTNQGGKTAITINPFGP